MMPAVRILTCIVARASVASWRGSNGSRRMTARTKEFAQFLDHVDGSGGLAVRLVDHALQGGSLEYSAAPKSSLPTACS